jgi:hypothetical protein
LLQSLACELQHPVLGNLKINTEWVIL